MIRAVLQRPGRLRMRLTVVAAASALFALIVLAALVLPSLQHNLEQSRVDSLRASVLASNPSQYLNTFLGTPSSETLQAYAGTLGAGRVAVFERNGVFLETVADSAPRSQLAGARRLVEETASLRRDLSAVQRLPEGRTAVLTVYISTSQGTEGVLLVEAPLRDVQEQVSAVERRLVVGGILAFVVALIAGALAAEPLARRLARLRAAADRIAHGWFSEPIVDNSHDEIGELARSLEEMRIRLEALERSRSAFIANA